MGCIHTLALICSFALANDTNSEGNAKSVPSRKGTGFVIVADRDAAAWRVRSVWRGSPAEKAGIKVGDRVTSVAGVALPAPASPLLARRIIAQMNQAIQSSSADEIAVELRRRGTTLTVRVRLEPLDRIAERAGLSPPTAGAAHKRKASPE